MRKIAVRLGKDGTVTTYVVDKKGNFTPKAAVKNGNQVVTEFPAVPMDLASIQADAIDLFILEARRVPKKKKKRAKMKAKTKAKKAKT